MQDFYLSNLTGQFDWGPLVDRIMKIKSLPIKRLEEQTVVLKGKQEAYFNLLSKVNDLKNALNTNIEDLFKQKRAISSDTNVAVASASPNTPNVSLSVNVQSLAQREMLLSTGAVSDMDQIISWKAFTLKLNTGSTIEIQGTISDGSGKLQDLVNAINSLPNSKIEASVFFDGSQYRLLLAEKDEGASTFETLSGATAILVDYSDPSGFGGPLWFIDSANPLQFAKNAKMQIGSNNLTSPTNTFNNIITGLNVTVRATGSTTIKVEDDNIGISNFLQNIVSKYNEVVKQVSDLTGLNKPLQGDQVILGIKRELSNALDPLFRKGLLNVKEDGTVSLDTSILDRVIKSDREGLKSLLVNVSTQMTSITSALSTDLDRMAKDYGSRVEALNNRASALYESLRKEEARLKLEFSKVEAFMNQAKGIMDRLQNLIVTLSEMQGGKKK